MKEILKDLIQILKERRLERKQWKRLMSKDMDVRFLVQLINIAEVTDRAVDIKLVDGTLIKVYDPSNKPRETRINEALQPINALPRLDGVEPGQGLGVRR